MPINTPTHLTHRYPSTRGVGRGRLPYPRIPRAPPMDILLSAGGGHNPDHTSNGRRFDKGCENGRGETRGKPGVSETSRNGKNVKICKNLNRCSRCHFRNLRGRFPPVGFAQAELASNSLKHESFLNRILIDALVVIFGIYGVDFPPTGSPRRR